MGYYQGNGARLITTLHANRLSGSGTARLYDRFGIAAYTIAEIGESLRSWAVPSTATSGIYFAHLIRNDTSGESLIFFVVRNDASTSAMLFQTADESWQAYNNYGGFSLYGASGFDLTNRAYKVSYNRPLINRDSRRSRLLCGISDGSMAGERTATMSAISAVSMRHVPAP